MACLVSPHQVTFALTQLAHARKVAGARSAPHREVLCAQLTLLVAETPMPTRPPPAG